MDKNPYKAPEEQSHEDLPPAVPYSRFWWQICLCGLGTTVLSIFSIFAVEFIFKLPPFHAQIDARTASQQIAEDIYLPILIAAAYLGALLSIVGIVKYFRSRTNRQLLEIKTVSLPEVRQRLQETT